MPGFLWPPSFVDEGVEILDMEVPVTHLVLWVNLSAEYTVGGAPVLTRYPSIHLEDVLAEGSVLRAIVAYRWPERVPAETW